MTKLVLLRHGQSKWNLENRFTGWTDIGLTPKGEKEARTAGQMLKKLGFEFDIAFSSVLSRSTETLALALEELDQTIPTVNSWRLNERHYGALQGMDKAEIKEKYGEMKVHMWRRSYDVRPPPVERDDPRWPGNDPKYSDLKPEEIPTSEDLKDTEARLLPLWENDILPKIKEGKRVLIVAHGNSLRALQTHLDHISPEGVLELNIPTGIPFVYEFDENLRPMCHYYLYDPESLSPNLKGCIELLEKGEKME